MVHEVSDDTPALMTIPALETPGIDAIAKPYSDYYLKELPG